MKKLTMIASALLILVGQAFAQKEFKVAKSTGKLVINNVSNLIVEGYEGKEIIFNAAGNPEKTEDPRAAGLSALSNSGFDNTGIGISITERENSVVVNPIKSGVALKVKLPQSMTLSIKTSGLANQDSVIMLSNIKSEIDAATQYESFKLANVTGPISLKTLYGNIEGKLPSTFKGPISLVSVYGFVDVSIPESAKADLSITTQYETLYAAKDLKLVLEEAPAKDPYTVSEITTLSSKPGQNVEIFTVNGVKVNTTPIKVKGSGTVITNVESSSNSTSASAPSAPEKPTPAVRPTTARGLTYTTNGSAAFAYGYGLGNTINGKLNGGGEKVILKSTYGKIYLRK
ncbi:hypothetical protein ACQKCH_09675 [Nubsella zeaxanthinifaciens]|uniref:hypothetical protein n=1 Tax=Nubsella zeaxanthinifaciens TaxID=392412 RepID=UPI003CFEA517